MSAITSQYRNTVIRHTRDVTTGLKRQLSDAQWIGGFILPMVGSLGHECGGFAIMEEGKPTVMGSLGGISFGQWTGMSTKPPGGRRYQYMAFCRAHHLHPYGYDAALGFLLHELTSTAKGVVMATLNSGMFSIEQAEQLLGEAAAQKCDRFLLARVVKFEKLYENAGTKHYPSRYDHAMMAKQVITEWAAAGYPDPDKYVMPKSRFSAQFDAEFGRGETSTTTRWDSVKTIAPLPDGRVAIENHAGQATIIEAADDPAAALDAVAPAPAAMPVEKARAGRWPEDSLSRAEVEAIQLRLRQLGFVRVGVCDGRWGTATIGAVTMLQTEAGIDPDGHYGPATRKALMNGVRHTVPAERANATSKELLEAGEPTLQAVHPVSITAKVGAVGSFLVALVNGITTAWPQASTTIDQVKGYFADVPGWAWFAMVTVVALYLWVSTRQVKRVVVDGYRQGAVTTLARPLHDQPHDEVPFMPGVPDTADAEPATANLFPGVKMAFDSRAPAQIFHRDHDSPTSEPERPLGVE